MVKPPPQRFAIDIKSVTHTDDLLSHTPSDRETTIESSQLIDNGYDQYI